MILARRSFFGLITFGLVSMSGASYAEDKMVEGLMVSNPWARASAGAAQNGAAYLTITNSGAEIDRLVGVQTTAAVRAELHTHIRDGDIMRMEAIDAVDLPSGTTTTLAPGGDHIMLMSLEGPLVEGEKVSVSLTFEKAGDVTVEAMIMAVGATEGPMDHGDHQ